jgi:hypothetical protein
MAILTFPSIVPDNQTFGITYNTQLSSSFSGIAQTVEMPGARWNTTLNFRDLTPVDSATLKAKLLELRGSAGRIFYGDLSHTDPFNSVSGSLTVDSASTSRIVRTTYDSASELLSVGDYIQLGADDQRELKMVIDHTIVSGTTYDIIVEPMIRRTDFVGLSIVYTDPKGVFLLTSDDQASWTIIGKALLSDISLEFSEVFVA